MKLTNDQICDLRIYQWEDTLGTSDLDWFECYNMYLPYWVAFMPKYQQKEHVNLISKTQDFKGDE